MVCLDYEDPVVGIETSEPVEFQQRTGKIGKYLAVWYLIVKISFSENHDPAGKIPE